MLELSLLQKISIWILPILLSVTLHEAAHAYMADKLGDKTARMLGRLSLNPIKHIDPFGTVILPILLGFLTHFQFVFGYAKPVMINARALKNPKKDMMWIALAGPLANILMALLWALAYKIATFYDLTSSSALLFVILTAQAGIKLNLVLACFNLLPLPTLDGSSIIKFFLSPKYESYYEALEPYAMPILLILMFTGLLQLILNPMIVWSMGLIIRLFQL